MAARAVFPGSFNPPTIAHLAIAEAVRSQHRVAHLDLVISRRALAKEHVEHPRFIDRVEVVRRTIAPHPWIGLVVTDAQLLVDIARGYDLLIVGADKWSQIQELRWYGSPSARDEALAALPPTVVVPRLGHDNPGGRVLELDDATLAAVSSTRARRGELDLMTPAARHFANDTGAWVDPVRYERNQGPNEEPGQRRE